MLRGLPFIIGKGPVKMPKIQTFLQTQSLFLISRNVFVKLQWLQVQNFSSFRSGFHTILIRSVWWGQGKSGKKCAELSGKVGEFKLSWLVGTLHTPYGNKWKVPKIQPDHSSTVTVWVLVCKGYSLLSKTIDIMSNKFPICSFVICI